MKRKSQYSLPKKIDHFALWEEPKKTRDFQLPTPIFNDTKLKAKTKVSVVQTAEMQIRRAELKATKNEIYLLQTIASYVSSKQIATKNKEQRRHELISAKKMLEDTTNY